MSNSVYLEDLWLRDLVENEGQIYICKFCNGIVVLGPATTHYWYSHFKPYLEYLGFEFSTRQEVMTDKTAIIYGTMNGIRLTYQDKVEIMKILFECEEEINNFTLATILNQGGKPS